MVNVFNMNFDAECGWYIAIISFCGGLVGYAA